jgi:hypothetical protein
MKDFQANFTKIFVKKKALVFEGLGFLLIILACWVTEYFDPPFSYTQVIIESTVIILLGGITVFLAGRLIQRIKYLEGFQVICASCKSIRIDDHWVRIENVITDNSEAQLSHGLCPSCTEKLYGKFLKKKKS